MQLVVGIVHCVSLVFLHIIEEVWCQRDMTWRRPCPSGNKCMMQIYCKPDEMKLIVGSPKGCEFDIRLNTWLKICCPESEVPFRETTEPTKSEVPFRESAEPTESLLTTNSNQGCTVPDILNGYTIRKKKTRKIEDRMSSWLSQFDEVETGSFFDPDQMLYVVCSNNATFLGKKEKGNYGGFIPQIVCVKGRWSPHPACFIRHGCPIENQFDEYRHLSSRDYDVKILEYVCNDIDFAWLGSLKSDTVREDGFYIITFEIESVMKEGIEKREDIEGETRHFYIRYYCDESALTNHTSQSPKLTYLIMGKDGQKYKDENGVMRYRYFLDEKTVIVMWSSVEEEKDKKLQYTLSNIFYLGSIEKCNFGKTDL